MLHRLLSRSLPLIALAYAQTEAPGGALAYAQTKAPGGADCNDDDPHTWWLVVGVLVLVFGVAIAFFIGYYVASTVTPSVRYTPEAVRYSTAVTAERMNTSTHAPPPTLAAFSSRTVSPPRSSARPKLAPPKSKLTVVDDSPLDRYNFSMRTN